MKGFFAWLFSEHNSSLEIHLFDMWHFLYLFVIFGGTALLAVIFKEKARCEKVLRIMAYLTVWLYVGDFFALRYFTYKQGAEIRKAGKQAL